MVLCFHISYFLIYFSKNKKVHIQSLYYLVIFSMVSLPLVYLFALKNLAFYNYSLAHMLLHGFPEILYNYGIKLDTLMIVFSIYFIVITIATMRWSFTSLKRGTAYGPIIMLIGITLCIGIFGDSTLTTMLPALLLLAILSGKRMLLYTATHA